MSNSVQILQLRLFSITPFCYMSRYKKQNGNKGDQYGASKSTATLIPIQKAKSFSQIQLKY